MLGKPFYPPIILHLQCGHCLTPCRQQPQYLSRTKLLGKSLKPLGCVSAPMYHKGFFLYLNQRLAATLDVTDEQTLASMSALVSGKVAASSKGLYAAINATGVGTLARVSALVSGEVANPSERLVAALNVTDEGSLTCVSALEIGINQSASVISYLEERSWRNIRVISDYGGIPRHILAESAV